MKRPAPQPEHWNSFEENDRQFYRIPVTIQEDQEISFTIAQVLAEQFEVQDVLARGGGGIILKATDKYSKANLFIKGIVKYDLERENLEEPVEEIVESIRRSRHHLQTERRILVQLNNEGCRAVPKIINYVYDVNHSLTDIRKTLDEQEWSFDDQDIYRSEPYLIMNPVPGMALDRLLNEYFPNGMNWNIAIQIIDQIAEVIEILHQPIQLEEEIQWNLIYQDLKPGNIIVDEYGHATLLDFGGCQLIVNETVVLAGSHSPGYCAPECSGNSGNSEGITASADCFGLGTTLFHMLSGVNPQTLVPANRAKDDPKAVQFNIDLLKSHCPNSFVPFLLKCLSWNAEDRFQSIHELRENLHLIENK